MDATNTNKYAVNGLDRNRYEAKPYHRPLGYVATEMDRSYAECAIKYECAGRAAGTPYVLGRTVFGIIAAVGDLVYTSTTAVGSSIGSAVTCCKVESVNDYTKKQWKHCGTTVGEIFCFPLAVLCCPCAACGLTCCAPQIAPAALQAIKDARDGVPVVPVRQVMHDALDKAVADLNK